MVQSISNTTQGIYNMDLKAQENQDYSAAQALLSLVQQYSGLTSVSGDVEQQYSALQQTQNLISSTLASANSNNSFLNNIINGAISVANNMINSSNALSEQIANSTENMFAPQSLNSLLPLSTTSNNLTSVGDYRFKFDDTETKHTPTDVDTDYTAL